MCGLMRNGLSPETQSLLEMLMLMNHVNIIKLGLSVPHVGDLVWLESFINA